MFLGSLVIWLFDKRDYESYGDALWYSLQTVTTVGYGDVTRRARSDESSAES